MTTSSATPVDTVLAQLRAAHPNLEWSTTELGDYDQYAELDAPDVLVGFIAIDNDGEPIFEDEAVLIIDPCSTYLGELCDPSAWGICDAAAKIMHTHNRVFLAKYPCNDGPKFMAGQCK